MEENTTTETPVETGVEETLPVVAEQEPAVETPTDQEANTDSSQGEEASLPEVDEKVKKYAESHGLELDSPSAIKAVQMAMDNQAEFHRTRQRSSELEKATNEVIDENYGDDPAVNSRLQKLELKDSIRTFFDSTPEAREYESAMVELLPDNQHLIGDWEAIYAKAVLKNQGSLKSEGAKQALETLASKQQASAPTGSAVNSAPTTQPKITRAIMNERLQSGDTAWFRKHQAEINTLVAEGKLQ